MDADHNRGLISSSSTSTLPTPHPYRVGSKPLSDELRSKIIALYDGDLSYASHLLEPKDCIDPDDPMSWEHINDDDVDSDEDEDYKLFFFSTVIRLFSPHQDPLMIGKEIDGSPVFELYSIEIKKLDPLRDFSSIFMKGSNTRYRPMIIYKRPEGEKIPLNQPLPLINIFRLPSAENPVLIGLSNPSAGGWRFACGPPCNEPDYVEYGPRTEMVTDELTESEALISYELIESAAIAKLEFTFLDDKEPLITILSGSITATTDGDPSTKRIIRQFSSSEPSVLRTNEPVPVNRSVFGVSLGKSLHIQVKLKVERVGTLGFFKVDRNHTMRTIELSVPKETKSVEKFIALIKSEGIKMRVKVSWWDYMV